MRTWDPAASAGLETCATPSGFRIRHRTYGPGHLAFGTGPERGCPQAQQHRPRNDARVFRDSPRFRRAAAGDSRAPGAVWRRAQVGACRQRRIPRGEARKLRESYFKFLNSCETPTQTLFVSYSITTSCAIHVGAPPYPLRTPTLRDGWPGRILSMTRIASWKEGLDHRLVGLLGFGATDGLGCWSRILNAKDGLRARAARGPGLPTGAD